MSIADEPRPDPDPLKMVVTELCAAQRIQLADGDLEAVTVIYREYLRLIETIDAVEIAREAAPPLRLQIGQRPSVPIADVPGSLSSAEPLQR